MGVLYPACLTLEYVGYPLSALLLLVAVVFLKAHSNFASDAQTTRFYIVTSKPC